jgi:hypothetical protein
VFQLCIDHLDLWAMGEPAPRGEPIAVDGEPPVARRDEHGNTIGGLRTTFVDVPRARYFTCQEQMTGVMEPFPAHELRSLYGDHAGYVAAVEARAAELVAERWLLRANADEQVATAASPEVAALFDA